MTEFSICGRSSVEVFTLTLPSPLKGEGNNFRLSFFIRALMVFCQKPSTVPFTQHNYLVKRSLAF